VLLTALELFSIPGVYLGMFEQSILAGDTAAHKTRALAASLGLQSLAVAVAILIPLIFGDQMPLLRPWIASSVPLRAQPQPEPEKSAAAAPSAPSILRTPPRLISLTSLNPRRPETIGATILSDSDTFSSSLVGLSTGLEPSITSTLPTMIATPPAQPPPAAPVAKAPDKPHPVGGDVQAAKLIRKIIPQYPPLAKQARVSGTVQLTGVIAKDGTIEQLQVVSGNPLLVPAALAAVKQWLYRPTFLNGQPVEVIAPIDVIFTLSQ
jgi:protein TonB